jgi:hypothetical protein
VSGSSEAAKADIVGGRGTIARVNWEESVKGKNRGVMVESPIPKAGLGGAVPLHRSELYSLLSLTKSNYTTCVRGIRRRILLQ